MELQLSLGSIGDCALDAYRTSLMDWVDEMGAREVPSEDLLANHLREVQLTVHVKPGGKIRIETLCVARKKHQDLAGYYQYHHYKGYWYRQSSTKYPGR